MGYTNIDIDLLRTLDVACDLGAFVKAATHLGRSQSALSLQMKKLEEMIGRPLFRKNGRGLVLTETGTLLLGYARRILALNDEALRAARGLQDGDALRLGLPGELTEQWLSVLLRRFHLEFPDLQILAHVGREQELADKVADGELDIALSFGDERRQIGEKIGSCPLAWFAGPGATPVIGQTLSLVALGGDCLFRRRAEAVLDGAGIAWRLALASPSLPGLWSAVGAGIGVTLRAVAGRGEGMAFQMRPGLLPAPSEVPLILLERQRSDAPLVRLRALLLEQAALLTP